MVVNHPHMNFLHSLRDRFPAAFKASGIKLESQVKLGASAEAEDGTKLYTSADAWASGVDVFTYDEETDTATPAAGIYVEGRQQASC